MITIYWHCIGMTEDDKTLVACALDELAEHLKDERIKLTVTIKPLENEPELSKRISEKLDKLKDQSYAFYDCDDDIARVLMGNGRLFVYCHPDSYVADAARRACGLAKWGLTPTCGFFSAAYPPRGRLRRKFTIWHEAVHLLLRYPNNSDECYEPDPPYPKKADCNCDTCIMQYEPNAKWDGRLSMCDKITGFFKEMDSRLRGNGNYC